MAARRLLGLIIVVLFVIAVAVSVGFRLDTVPPLLEENAWIQTLSDSVALLVVLLKTLQWIFKPTTTQPSSTTVTIPNRPKVMVRKNWLILGKRKISSTGRTDLDYSENKQIGGDDEINA